MSWTHLAVVNHPPPKPLQGPLRAERVCPGKHLAQPSLELPPPRTLCLAFPDLVKLFFDSRSVLRSPHLCGFRVEGLVLAFLRI